MQTQITPQRGKTLSVSGRLRQTQARLQRTLELLVSKGLAATAEAVRRAKPFYRKLKLKMGSAWQDILDYRLPGAGDADIHERGFVERAALSVVEVLDGEDPLETFGHLDAEVQLEALQRIHEAFCQRLGIPAVQIVISGDMDLMGSYSYSHDTLLINADLLHRVRDRQKAGQVISTLIHETFHVFQYRAALDPEGCAVSRDVSRLWRKNMAHYIRFDQNPVAYHLQPLEIYAEYMENSMLGMLGDEVTLARLIRQIEEETEGGGVDVLV